MYIQLLIEWGLEALLKGKLTSGINECNAEIAIHSFIQQTFIVTHYLSSPWLDSGGTAGDRPAALALEKLTVGRGT